MQKISRLQPMSCLKVCAGQADRDAILAVSQQQVGREVDMLRAIRNAINPLSTGFTGWWCHSDVRAILNGKPRGAYRRRGLRRGDPIPPMDKAVRQARIAAIERIMTGDDPSAGQR
jgi:hypothetical protein